MAVTLLCGADRGRLGALIDRERIRVIEASPTIARGRWSRHRLGREAAKLAADERFDACFIPGNYHWPAIGALAALPDAVRPRIVAQVSAALVKPQRSGLRRWLFERTLQRHLEGADAVATLARQASADLHAIAPDLRCVAIPLPALDDDEPAPVAAQGTTIMAAGRLVPEKGFHHLVAALAKLPDPAVRLRIVGAGPEEKRLRDYARRLGLADRVDLHGYSADIRPLLRDARLFVLSSLFEGYAAVIVEALAAGLPVVATACTPAVEDLLSDPAVGRAVPIGDAGALAEAIAAMLSQPPPDPVATAALVADHRIGPVACDYLDLFAALSR